MNSELIKCVQLSLNELVNILKVELYNSIGLNSQ